MSKNTIEAEPGHKLGAVLSQQDADNSWEYYCHHCGSLRLALLPDAKPTQCGSCRHGMIEVERPGNERLAELRATAAAVLDPGGGATAR